MGFTTFLFITSVFGSALGFLSMKATGWPRYYARMTIYIVNMAIASSVGIVVAVPMTLAGRRYDVQWVVARTFGHLSRWFLGIDFVVEGAEHLSSSSAVYLGNHQSMLDLMYLGSIYPQRCSVMAKKSLKYTPLLGQFMVLAGAVFIDRGNSKEAMKSLANAGNEMKRRNASVWVFPEGTRTLFPTSDLLAFKKGAFHLAVQSGVPIVPVVCENYWRIYHSGVFESGTLRIRVLPPIATVGLTSDDVSGLAQRTRDAMLQALREISVPASDLPLSEKEKALDIPSLPQRESQDSLDVDARVKPSNLKPNPSVSESKPRRRDPSTGGWTSTSEDDDGMVIVDRPTM
ncbi:1-acylglycerol-3-phosphate O-acyltransferase [Tulasnella sp. 419]|nr:1-acylglycerol-3-phosphate O-acyltransferase [Tulasnella sp. 418]KAG8964329.1 1-acylglycerol-3-phosphate O-acyltransferase [Tulasnella sp. 419]